ncbi:MAG: site-specific integrase [Candidatus Lambdaproteobacteria bacterium]|nr:site-specific integrase [Candidatus Lambdaproteobacteria bacterium]
MEPLELSTVYREFAAYLQVEKGIAAATRRAYLKATERFLALCAGQPGALLLAPDWALAQLDRRAVEMHLGSLRTRRGWKTSSIALQATALREFFRFLHLKGHVAKNPLRGLRIGRVLQVPAPPAGDEAAVRALFPEASAGLAELRLALLLELLYGCALRPAQAYRLTGIDLAPGEREARLVFGETALGVPLSAAGCGRVARYLEARRRALAGGGAPAGLAPAAVPFWVDERGRACSPARLARAVARAMERAGLGGGAPALRQLAARHFRERGADVRSVQRLLGARRLGTLDRFQPPEFRDVVAQFRRLHPRAGVVEEEP